MSTCPPADRPSRRNHDSADECRKSGPSSASGSRRIPLEHPLSIYEMCGPAGAPRRHRPPSPRFSLTARCGRAAANDRATCEGARATRQPCSSTRTGAQRIVRRKFDRFLCQNCVRYPRNPGQTPRFTGTLGAQRALVRFGVRQQARAESISKRIPSSAFARAWVQRELRRDVPPKRRLSLSRTAVRPPVALSMRATQERRTRSG